MKKFDFLLLVFFSCCCFSCKQKTKENLPAHAGETNAQLIKRTKTSFKNVLGIRYTEVYRRFDNGVSFNAQGYQLKPSWKLYFESDTTAYLFSLIKKRYYDTPVTLDHDSLFNISGAWFKPRKITKDSLFFQVLDVKKKVINWKNSNVYVTFYSDDYVKNVLHTNAEQLRKTTKKDTTYVQSMAMASARDPKKIFAAQEPVFFKSKTPSVTVTNAKSKVRDLESDYIPDRSLFYPEYSVTIHKAYADFYHAFAVKIDAQGKLHFEEPMETMLPDERENTIKVMKGIMDGYLTLYLDITPGRTLGIPHDSLILLTVKGYKS